MSKFAYIGTGPCGCSVRFIVDDPKHKKETFVSIVNALTDGLSVVRMPIDDALGILQDYHTCQYKKKLCPDCAGVGLHDPGYFGCGSVRCRTCRGAGELYEDGTPIYEIQACSKTVEVLCSKCGGDGFVKVPTRPVSPVEGEK